MKKKVLIVYNYILHYRKPFFNELSKRYDVTVLHSGVKSIGRSDTYEEIITPVKKLGPFYLQSGVLQEMSNEKYDIVISLFDVRWVNILFHMLFRKSDAFHILWGAWVTNSSIANKMRGYFLKKSSANVFYTYEALNDFSFLEIPTEKMFVANNTFDVGVRVKSYKDDSKFRVLFVGSLDERKENDVLIRAFSNIKGQLPENIVLTFVGNGDQSAYLENLALELELGNRIEFLGRINEPEMLRNVYSESIVSVSYGQAGLSVLQSLGYGVPFLTKVNAISGGEKSNIKDGLNSVFCDDDPLSLEFQIARLCNNIDEARRLGKNAYEYYEKYCTIQNMTQGFIDAIEGTQLSIVDKNL